LNRFLIGLALLAGSAAVAAQAQAPASPEAKARAIRVSGALGACHARNATRLARSDRNPARVVDKVMAQCRTQENAVRAEVYRDLDARTAARVMQTQRAHWRRRVGELVARARARH
jgi:predicted secreted protein